MTMIQGVVFDWGGVIQRTLDHGPREELDRLLGLPAGGTEEAVFGSAVWERASRGACSAEEVWGVIAAGLGLNPERVGWFVERFFAGDRIDERLVALIRHLRGQGLRVALLSNASPALKGNTSPIARWGMDGLFDVQVFSYQVGALKPDPRTYAAAIAALGLPAEALLFIDDAPANVEGARAAGMDAIHFHGVDALWGALRARGLPLPD
ncbi:MAG: HAD family hydrolase [Anaerolineae bacterium]